MAAPILWIWDTNDDLIYEGQFSGVVMKSGKAYRYRHLCADGMKEGHCLTQEMINNAILFDTVDFEADGEINIGPTDA